MTGGLVELCVHHLETVGLERCGFGPDPYDPEPHHHPMAYALYARGLAALHRATGDSWFLDRGQEVGELLAALAHGSPPGWGLPFRWNGNPANHPYTLTTALCGHAMFELMEGGDRKIAPELVRRACVWLLEGVEWSDDRVSAGPWYAPGHDDVVVNVASQAGGLLLAASATVGIPSGEERGAVALRLVQESQHGLGYWTYRRDSEDAGTGAINDRSIDAVHTSYVLDGLTAAARHGGRRQIPGIRDALAEGLRFALENLFDSDGGQVRKLVSASLDTPEERRLIDMTAAPRYAGSRRWLVPYPGSAPLWGYGGMLGAVARALRAGVSELDRVLPVLWRLQETTLARPDGRFPHSSDDRGLYPRHEAHVFDGLAALAAGGRA